MQTNPGQPCGICGDIGIAKDIATCSKCRKSREHIYCMSPNLFNVPRSWHCEACRRDNLVHRNTCHSDGSRKYSDGEVQDFSKRQKTWISGNASSKVPDASNGIFSPSSRSGPHFLSKNVVPKKVANGKVKFIPAEDVCGPSGSKSKLKSLHGASNSQMRSLGTNRNPILRTSAPTESFPEKVRAHKSVSHIRPPTVGEVTSSTLQKPAVDFSQSLGGLKSQLPYTCKSSPREDFRHMSGLSVRDKRHVSEARPSPFGQTGTMTSGVRERPEFGKTSLGSKIDAGKVDSLPEKDYVCKDEAVKVQYKFGEEDLPNPPALIASWKGCFEVVNVFHELCDGFQAYLPEKVSRKAYVVSKQLPRVLTFKLLPRRDVWPEIFHSKPPCAFDIALYFWVDEFCSSRENYNRLIELMEKEDLSMRSHFGGAELLIFTSKQLPTESQRMNMQLYLWGIFHSTKAQQAPESPFRSYTATENIVSVSPKANEGTEIVASQVETWMTSNRNVTRRDDSQDAFSKIHSNQPVQNSTSSMHVHEELKREQWSEFDAPPGYSRSDDVPPGFSRPLTINASDDSHIVPPNPKMSHVAKEVNTPGTSNWTKLREEVSSSKVTASKELRATPSNGRGIHPIVKTADLPTRWKEGHYGRARVSTQPRGKSTRDPIPSKKPHDGKDLLAEKERDRDLSWDHLIQSKKEYSDGWGTPQSYAAIQSNKNEGWGNSQSVATQSHIQSKKLGDGNDLLGQQASGENSWDHLIPAEEEIHDGWGNWDSVSIQPSEKNGHNPIRSRKEDLLVKQANGWDHTIPPKRADRDGWGKKSNENNGARESTRKESNEDNNGRRSRWDAIRPKKEHYDGWGTNSVTPTQSNERDLRWDPIRPEREPRHGWGRDFTTTQSREENARRNPSIRSKSEPHDGRSKDLASTQHARTDAPIRPNKHNERERDRWRRDRR